MTEFRRRVITAILALALAAPALAQETRGSIEGVVKDASGGVLPGVTVEAKNKSGATASTTTDERGIYRFPALPVGTYTVVATLQGFNTAQRADVLLTIGQQLKADLTLTVGTVSETVSVKAEAPIVDVKKNAVSTTITAETIDLIPKGRDFLDAITGIPVRRRRHGHHEPADRRVRQAGHRRLHRSDSGAALGLQRGISRGHGRRHQRHLEERHEPLPR
jgi:hypothetical protein